MTQLRFNKVPSSFFGFDELQALEDFLYDVNTGIFKNTKALVLTMIRSNGAGKCDDTEATQSMDFFGGSGVDGGAFAPAFAALLFSHPVKLITMDKRHRESEYCERISDKNGDRERLKYIITGIRCALLSAVRMKSYKLDLHMKWTTRKNMLRQRVSESAIVLEILRCIMIASTNIFSDRARGKSQIEVYTYLARVTTIYHLLNFIPSANCDRHSTLVDQIFNK